MQKIIIGLLGLFLVGCAGTQAPTEFIKPSVNEKIAIIIKNYQNTKCLEHCLSERVETCYNYLGEEKCINVCPYENSGYKCIDLRPDENGDKKTYWVDLWEWHNYIEALTVISFLEQDYAILEQIDFLCKHDFVLCENHLDPIEELQRFVAQRYINENRDMGEE